jgi:hypothetical protein
VLRPDVVESMSSFRYNATVPPRKCISHLTSDAIPNNSKDCGMKSKIMFASVLAGLLAIRLWRTLKAFRTASSTVRRLATRPQVLSERWLVAPLAV